MRTRAEPVYEATVSPDLVMLLSDRVLNGPDTSGQKIGRDRSVRIDMDGDLFPKQVLRRDGGHPIVLNAAVLYAECDAHVPSVETEARVVRTFRLYITRDQKLVAQIVLEPENCAARPLHRAEPIASVAGLAAFLHNLTPDLCFGAAPPTSPRDADHWARIEPEMVPVMRSAAESSLNY